MTSATDVRHHVVAVVVSHDGEAWLPDVLSALSRQDRQPDHIIGVDTGSIDASRALMVAALGDVVDQPRGAGFGAAAAAGLERASVPDPQATSWVWLLHDDSAPREDCLARLLAAADAEMELGSAPGVIGPKARGWHDRRLLVEAGATITAAGRRETGLESGERDQGQHDAIREVLAVGSAGMLVRRDVWDALQGFDPMLPLYRDDLDFCWRAHRAGYSVQVAPDAIIHHREASTHRRRKPSVVSGTPQAAGKDASLHVILAHAPLWRLPFTMLRVLLGGILRTLGWLVGKDLAAARDEAIATAQALSSPIRLARSRARIRRTTSLPASVAKPLRPTLGTRTRDSIDRLAVRLAAVRPGAVPDTASPIGAIESGPVGDDAEYLVTEPSSRWVRRGASQPGLVVTLALVVLSLIAARSLWLGSGSLLGGALLPAPAGAGDLWEMYLAAWHDVAAGSSIDAPPYLAVIAAVSAVLLGKAPLAVTVIMLLSVPLAGASAFLSLRGVIAHPLVRAWMSVAYALLPGLTAGLAGGRLGTVATAILLPPLARIMLRCSGKTTLPPATGRTVWAAAILLAVTASFTPVTWVIVAAAAVVMALTRRVTRLRLLAPVVIAPLLLLPWSLRFVEDPLLLLLEAGVGGGATVGPVTSPLGILLLDPTGTGSRWVAAGILAAGVAAAFTRERRAAGVLAWLLGLVALSVGVLQASMRVDAPGAPGSLVPWTGVPTLVLGASLLVIAGLATDGLWTRVTGSAFGWRQPLIAVVAVAAVASPVVAAVLWLPGAGGELRRAEPTAIPAFVAEETIGPQRPRTLLISYGAGLARYALVSGPGPTLGDADVMPDDQGRLDVAVAALVAGRAGAEVDVLATYAVRFVELVAPVDAQAADTLDSVPGLRRLSSSGGEALWRVDGVTSRVRAVSGGEASALDLGGSPGGWTTSAPSGTLVLSQSADPRWRAVGQTSLEPAAPPADMPWAQAFAVPSAEQVTVSYDGTERTRWLWIQAALLLIALVLALPGRVAADDDPDVADAPAEPADLAGVRS